MMTIAKIKEYILSISDIQVIAKDFDIDTTEYHLIGAYRKNGENRILLLAYSEKLRELADEYETEISAISELEKPKTVREEEKNQIRFHKDFIGLKSINIGGNLFQIRSSQCTQMSNRESAHALLLSKFIEYGWTCERFSEYSPYSVYVITCTLAENKTIDFSEKITISFRPDSERFLAEIPLTLKPDLKSEVVLPSGEKVYIRNVKAFDLYRYTDEVFSDKKILESVSPEELNVKRKEIDESNQQLCPKGKVFLTVEYEAPESISLDIKTKETLDAFPKNSGGAFAVIYPASLTAEHQGYKVKVSTISEPFLPDFKAIEAEIFSYSVTTQADDISI